MRSPRAAAALLALGTLLAPAAFVRAQERPSSPEYREACEGLVCQCGCNSTVATCAMEHCHSAEPMREEVWERIAKGESVASILAVFRDRYGLHVLSAPPTSGFHLTAWVMPFVALALGAFVIAIVLRSWSRRAQDGVGVDAPAAPSLSREERARIERELRDFSR